MSDYWKIPFFSKAEAESIVVDAIEVYADDYQSFDWGPVSCALAMFDVEAKRRFIAHETASGVPLETVRATLGTSTDDDEFAAITTMRCGDFDRWFQARMVAKGFIKEGDV